MLPRSGSIESVGSSASSCALAAAPTPCRCASRRGSRRRRRARRADRRARDTRRPRALRDRSRSCPSPSARRRRSGRSSSASSSSLTNTPREPISPNGFVRSRSPAVVIGTSAISMPGARRCAAASSACVSASLLPRLPTRISTARPAPDGLPAREMPRGPNADERCRHLQRQRTSRQLPELQRSSSPRPNRCRTASA